MSKVVIIGAGASGIVAALQASKNKNNEVILIDGNNRCGKKLLITGNGKCNFWNDDIDIKNYFTSELELASSILSNQEEVLNYLYSIGIYPKTKNGYFYPASGLAASIREIFEKELNRSLVKLKYNTRVIDIEKYNDNYKIKTEQEIIIADKLIIATGSKAFPKTGSEGFGYNIATKFGHNIMPVLPALTGLLSDNKNIKEWSGVRTDSLLKLYIDNKYITEELGEIQLTENGVSGICTFNISGLVSKALYDKRNVVVKINFLPWINNIEEFISKRNIDLKDRTIEELLESILNYKLTNVILTNAHIDKNSYWNKLNDVKKESLINNIKNFELNITSTNSFEKAQVCTGGISLKEVNNNLESIYNKNLYFCGEILDVDGKCGGFNLAFAFITGYIVGKNV